MAQVFGSRWSGFAGQAATAAAVAMLAYACPTTAQDSHGPKPMPEQQQQTEGEARFDMIRFVGLNFLAVVSTLFAIIGESLRPVHPLAPQIRSLIGGAPRPCRGAAGAGG